MRFHGNLWAPIILHMVNNSIVVLAGAATVL
jgi:membrane protease YdiL (CAAX protease family)